VLAVEKTIDLPLVDYPIGKEQFDAYLGRRNFRAGLKPVNDLLRPRCDFTRLGIAASIEINPAEMQCLVA